MNETLYQILVNKVVLSLIITFILTELTKLTIGLWKTKKFILANLFQGGGMPSGHSSLVSALTFSILFNQGFSILWVAVLIFSLVILRDSFGVRKHAGEQAKVLNILLSDSKTIKHLDVKLRNKLSKTKLQEHIGHKPIETIWGIIFGLVVSLIVWLV